MTPSLRQHAFLLCIVASTGCALLQPRPSLAEVTEFADSSRSHSTVNDLDVPYTSQEVLLGVPTSASMIMAFYGDVQLPRKLKTMSRGKTYTSSDPFNDFSITFYRDLVKAAAILGYDWHEKTFDNNSSGLRQGLAVIKDEIAHRRPVMIDVSSPEGHTIVVTGFDETTQSLLVVDPSIPAPGRYAMTYLRLQSIWNEHALHRNFRSLVITSPLPYTS